MYAFLIDENKRIVSYQPTTYELIKVEVDRPVIPSPPKMGVNYVEYWNPETQQIELREEERPLTTEEVMKKYQEALERTNEAVQDLALTIAGGEGS